MREKFIALAAWPLAIILLVIGIHMQHNPTGKVAKNFDRWMAYIGKEQS